MLLFLFSPDGKYHYIGMQKENFLFSRFDSYASVEYSYGRKWLSQGRFLTGPNEWTQVGPLNMVQWGK